MKQIYYGQIRCFGGLFLVFFDITRHRVILATKVYFLIFARCWIDLKTFTIIPHTTVCRIYIQINPFEFNALSKMLSWSEKQ